MTEGPQPILLTGATGFVGSHVLRELLRRNYSVRALVRRPDGLALVDSRLSKIVGNILDPGSLISAVDGCQAVIHLVGIIAEKGDVSFEETHVTGTRNVLHAARQAGVRRFIHMSALGTRPNAVSTYHQTKWAAEELVRQAGIPYTIFRPSLIHGPDGEFTRMLAAWARGAAPPYWFMPYFGAGFFGQRNPARLAPVYVDDVAQLFVWALGDPRAADQTYDIAGPDAYTWPELLTLAARLLAGKRKPAIGLPAWLARILLALGLPVPFNRDQIIMSLEDNTVSPPTAPASPLPRDFLGPSADLTLHSFAWTMTQYRSQVP